MALYTWQPSRGQFTAMCTGKVRLRNTQPFTDGKVAVFDMGFRIENKFNFKLTMTIVSPFKLGLDTII